MIATVLFIVGFVGFVLLTMWLGRDGETHGKAGNSTGWGGWDGGGGGHGGGHH